MKEMEGLFLADGCALHAPSALTWALPEPPVNDPTPTILDDEPPEVSFYFSES